MAVETEDLIAIISPIRDRLKEVQEVMDAHGTHMTRLRIVADKTHALMERGSVERAAWVQIANDHLEAVIACYDDLTKLESLYADMAQGVSDSMSNLKP